MKILYVESKWPWAEFTTVRGGETYLFIYHLIEHGWTVLKVRPDQEREIMTADDASALLRDFPKKNALDMLGLEK